MSGPTRSGSPHCIYTMNFWGRKSHQQELQELIQVEFYRYPVRSKHCNYRLYTFSYIVGLGCTAVALPSHLIECRVPNHCSERLNHLSGVSKLLFWQLDSMSKQ